MAIHVSRDSTDNQLPDKRFTLLAVKNLAADAMVREYIKQHGQTLPVLMNRDHTVTNQFGAFRLPVNVFIDEKGVVREYIKGGLLIEEVILNTMAHMQKQEPVKSASLH